MDGWRWEPGAGITDAGEALAILGGHGSAAVGRLTDSEPVRTRFKTLCGRAGVPYIGLHGLRRTVGSVLVAHGESLKATADMLGHKGLDVTFQRYVKATETQRRDATTTVAKVVFGAAPAVAGTLLF